MQNEHEAAAGPAAGEEGGGAGWTSVPSGYSIQAWGSDGGALLWRILPEEDLIYFGDTARVPYGSRSREAILKYARQDVRFLRSFDLKAILIACGTVTTTSLAALQAENDLPMVGVVEPTCRRAVLMTQNKRVGLIATAASVRSGAYEAALRRLDPEVTVFSRACPCSCPGGGRRIRRGDVVIETVAREYLTPLKNAGWTP